MALLRLQYQHRIVLHMLQKDVPVVPYIDKQTLRQKMMNLTTTSLPEIMYHRYEYVNVDLFNCICLIESKFSPADAMTKKNPNTNRKEALKTSYHVVLVKRIFMLLQSLYRHSSFILTSKVRMVDDPNKD